MIHQLKNTYHSTDEDLVINDTRGTIDLGIKCDNCGDCECCTCEELDIREDQCPEDSPVCNCNIHVEEFECTGVSLSVTDITGSTYCIICIKNLGMFEECNCNESMEFTT